MALHIGHIAGMGAAVHLNTVEQAHCTKTMLSLNADLQRQVPFADRCAVLVLRNALLCETNCPGLHSRVRCIGCLLQLPSDFVFSAVEVDPDATVLPLATRPH